MSQWGDVLVVFPEAGVSLSAEQNRLDHLDSGAVTAVVGARPAETSQAKALAGLWGRHFSCTAWVRATLGPPGAGGCGGRDVDVFPS